ncbi:hypothetical protein [Streptomyces botrytidirepellens]|uniref:hypothetical protein n=1 Tax=Streptomyces botrytidirepellens TaxID=2486417 RepID=UPI0011CD817F|nr:hypothetical protein [Streptomyces botrytidirepellens]
MTSIEWTAYLRFKWLIAAHELHLFFSPTCDGLEWAAVATDRDEHLLGLPPSGIRSSFLTSLWASSPGRELS